MPKSHRAHVEWTPSRLIHCGETVPSSQCPCARRFCHGSAERSECRDFLEISDDRYRRRSLILIHRCRLPIGNEQIGIRPLPIAFSTAWSILSTASNSAANRCAKSAAGNRTKELPNWVSTVLMWGQEAQTLLPCPTPESLLNSKRVA